MKKIFLLIPLLLLYMSCKESVIKSETASILPQREQYLSKPDVDHVTLSNKAEEALRYSKQNKMNTDFCILIDMRLHSGVKRFFIWNFKQKKSEGAFLVGHGCGNFTWSSDETKDEPQFSNINDSHLSSLGKYKIGERGYSSWGINVKYLMHGLEESNSNALSRVIVFHSWDLMSDDEVFPKGSPEGWGCPTVYNNAMKIIDERLKKAKEPVLMWIYV